MGCVSREYCDTEVLRRLLDDDCIDATVKAKQVIQEVCANRNICEWPH